MTTEALAAPVEDRVQNGSTNWLARTAGKICIAAIDARNLLENDHGPNELMRCRLRRRLAVGLLVKTRTPEIVLKMLYANGIEVAGAGAQNIALHSLEAPDRVFKYDRTVVSNDPTVLTDLLDHYQQQYQQTKQRFGDLVADTQFDLGYMPYRWRRPGYVTVCTCQEYFTPIVDIFSTQGRAVIASHPEDVLRGEIDFFINTTKKWASEEDTWPDLLGPENIVLTPQGQDWHLKIVDPFPCDPARNDLVLPGNPLTNRQRLANQMAYLDSLHDEFLAA